MRKKRIPEVLVRSVVSLYDGANKSQSGMSEKVEVKVQIHQRSALSPILFAVVVVAIELTREGVLSELLYADDLLMMSKTIVGLINKFIKWNEIF